MSEFEDDPDDVCCAEWASGDVPVASLPRMKLDVPALRQAARDIVHEPPGTVSMVMKAAATDKRLLPHIVRAMAERNAAKEMGHGRS